jgi:hypothetical protein
MDDYSNEPKSEVKKKYHPDTKLEAKPPAATESIGSVEPAKPVTLPGDVAKDETLKEKARLDRMGVESDADGVRGLNVVAEGHYPPDSRNYPAPEPTSASGSSEYTITAYGHTVPAESINAPVTGPDVPAPVVPAVPVPVVVPTKK